MHRRDRFELARTAYAAFAAGERSVMEDLLAPDYEFHSPPDPRLDREGYFERCWPQAGNETRFDFVRLIEDDDEVVVTYEATRTDGTRFRNTEVLSFDGEKIAETEVYFGWNLD